MDKEQLIILADEIYKSNMDVSNHWKDALDITLKTMKAMGEAGDIDTREYTFIIDYLQRYKK